MKKSHGPLKLLSLGLASLLMTAAAEAKCTTDGKLSFRPIENDTHNISVSCDAKGQNKEFKAGTGYTFTTSTAIRQPRHGKLEVRTGGFKYNPRKGFSGNDSFALRICATKGGQSGCSTLNYNVNVN